MEPHPIRLVVKDDRRRSRLTVFFRILLVLPHLIWLWIWASAALYLVGPIAWLLTLILGRLPEPLWRFYCSLLRYATHVYAYIFLAGNPFPGFTGTEGTYPIDLEIDEPGQQSRWKTLFRIILAVPAFLLLGSLLFTVSVYPVYDETTGRDVYIPWISGLALTVAVLAWFACLVLGRISVGFRDLLAYSLRYAAQTWGYLLLVTDRYPDADPADPSLERPPYRPVAVALGEDDLRRSRVTVFFRLLLTLPHLVWLVLWTILAYVVIVIGWFATLALGRLPAPFHRFVAAWLRYQVHVLAFLTLVANPFPGFTGAAGSYPVDVRIDPPARQHRLKTLFRLLLAFPAHLVNSALSAVLWVVAFLGWFVGLFLGRMPRGLRGLGALALGYHAQTTGYLSLLTDTYPYSGPPGVDLPEPEEEPETPLRWPGPLPLPS